uniref:Hexosyltransferase n=1 Tax=Ciona savignyi TaxID=51511 RepID=H2YYJ9_CIOSA
MFVCYCLLLQSVVTVNNTVGNQKTEVFRKESLKNRRNFTKICSKVLSNLPTAVKHTDKNGFQELPERYLSNKRDISKGYSCGNAIAPEKASENPWMTILVKTAPSNFENRKILRETWGKIRFFKGKIFSLLFMVGLAPSSSGLQMKLQEENAKYGDILQCNFVDKYEALPIKVLSTFRWIIETNHQSRFYSVTDDDCVINIAEMHSIFTRLDTSEVKTDNTKVAQDDHNTIYCGYTFNEGAVPQRESSMKWNMPMELYSGDYYPAYCLGALWTLSYDILQALACVSTVTDIEDFFVEDVLISGILREKLGQGSNNIKPLWEKRWEEKKRLLAFHSGKLDNPKKRMLEKWREWSTNMSNMQ